MCAHQNSMTRTNRHSTVTIQISGSLFFFFFFFVWCVVSFWYVCVCVCVQDFKRTTKDDDRSYIEIKGGGENCLCVLFFLLFCVAFWTWKIGFQPMVSLTCGWRLRGKGKMGRCCTRPLPLGQQVHWSFFRSDTMVTECKLTLFFFCFGVVG